MRCRSRPESRLDRGGCPRSWRAGLSPAIPGGSRSRAAETSSDQTSSRSQSFKLTTRFRGTVRIGMIPHDALEDLAGRTAVGFLLSAGPTQLEQCDPLSV